MDTLQKVIRRGNESEIRKSIKGTRPGTINLVDEFQQTALHIACLEGDVNAVKLLLKKKADLHARDKNGWTPLHCACSKPHLLCVEVLLQQDSINAGVGTLDCTTPLHYLVKHNVEDSDVELFQRLLPMMVERGASLYARNKHGEAALHQACLKGNTTAVRFFLTSNMCTEITNKQMETPLHYAVTASQLGVAQLLLELGADPNLTNMRDQVPLDIARLTNQQDFIQMLKEPKPIEEAFSEALQTNNKTASDKLIKEFVKDSDSKNLITRALFLAVIRGSTAVVEQLLKAAKGDKIDLAQKNDVGATPLHYMVRHRIASLTNSQSKNNKNTCPYMTCLQHMLDRGASVNAQTVRGEFPLHIAAGSGNEPVVKWLLEHNAKPNLFNKLGETALHYAVMGGSLEVVVALLAADADRSVNSLSGETACALADKTCQTQIAKLLGSRVETRQGSPTVVDDKAKRKSSSRATAKPTKAPSKKGKADAFAISAPSNFVQKVHVDDDYNWSGEDPSKTFEVTDKLGEGAYGAVYKGIHRETGFVVAIKELNITENLDEIKKEIDILKKCRNDLVVRYFGCCYKEEKLWILMDYCGAGAVCDIYKKIKPVHKTFIEDEIAAIIVSVLEGLVYLHSIGTIHRDLKSGNILINSEGDIKIADFGVSAELGNAVKATTTIGTPLFMSPEVIDGSKYDSQADIWSLGITAIEMADGVPPHFDEHIMRAMFQISSGDPPTLKTPADWSDNFNDFLRQCLCKDPEQRPTAATLLSHPFIIETLDSKDSSAIVRGLLRKAGVEVSDTPSKQGEDKAQKAAAQKEAQKEKANAQQQLDVPAAKVRGGSSGDKQSIKGLLSSAMAGTGPGEGTSQSGTELDVFKKRIKELEEETDVLRKKLEASENKRREAEKLIREISEDMSTWAGKMEAVGIKVKGVKKTSIRKRVGNTFAKGGASFA